MSEPKGPEKADNDEPREDGPSELAQKSLTVKDDVPPKPAPETIAEPDAPAGAADGAEGESSGASEAEEGDAAREPAAAKVRMPKAGQIPRGDFTPHAFGTRTRATRRPANRAAARRRKIFYTTGTVVVAAALAGAMTFYLTRPKPAPKVRGAFGKAPAMSVPKVTPAPKREVKSLISGKGRAVAKGDLVVVHFTGHSWSTKGGKELLSTYKKGGPLSWPSGRMSELPPLDRALVGKKAGSRLLVTLPYKDVGELASSMQLAATDDLVLSVDLLGVYPKTAVAQGTPQKVDDKGLPTVTYGAAGTAPTIKLPDADPPAKLRYEALLQGAGPVVTKDQTLVMQYQAVLWRNGKVFESTWKRGAPSAIPVGSTQAVAQGMPPGLAKGLIGQHVGSRMLIMLPPGDGYGKSGRPQMGIKGTDTMVFVVDVLGAH